MFCSNEFYEHSGWSHPEVAIIAPRLSPADIIMHIASQVFINESGPDADAINLLTNEFSDVRQEISSYTTPFALNKQH